MCRGDYQNSVAVSIKATLEFIILATISTHGPDSIRWMEMNSFVVGRGGRGQAGMGRITCVSEKWILDKHAALLQSITCLWFPCKY